jgi:hypothetical protein
MVVRQFKTLTVRRIQELGDENKITRVPKDSAPVSRKRHHSEKDGILACVLPATATSARTVL